MNEINGSIWYDVISNEKGVITNFYDKNVAIQHAKEKGYDYVMKVIDFEPIEIVWEKEN